MINNFELIFFYNYQSFFLLYLYSHKWRKKNYIFLFIFLRHRPGRPWTGTWEDTLK